MRVPVSISYRGPQQFGPTLRCSVRKEVLYETAQSPPLVQRSPGELSLYGLPGDSLRPVARSITRLQTSSKPASTATTPMTRGNTLLSVVPPRGGVPCERHAILGDLSPTVVNTSPWPKRVSKPVRRFVAAALRPCRRFLFACHRALRFSRTLWLSRHRRAPIPVRDLRQRVVRGLR